MALYVIPKEHIKIFLAIQNAPEKKFNDYIKKLNSVTKILIFSDLQKLITNQNGIINAGDDSESLFDITYTLFNLYISSEKSTEGFLDDLISSLKEKITKNKPKELLNLEKIRKRISLFLSIKNILLSFKVLGLKTEYEKRYSHHRFVTDIRPIFSDVEDNLTTALLVHNLSITYYDGEGSKKIMFSLTSQDLIKLKESIQRAEKKEISIRKNLGKTINLISPIVSES